MQLEPTESQIQKAYFDWVRVNENRDPRFRLIFACPNGAATSDANRGRLIREGLRNGVSDVIGLFPAWVYHGFVAEFKTKKGRLSKEQKEFLKEASMRGYAPFVWRSVDEAIESTKLYMGQKVDRCITCGRMNDGSK